MIQDYIFSAGEIFFIIALVPSLFSPKKPSTFMSTMTGIILCIYAPTQATLGMVLNPILTSIAAAMWLILAYQAFKQNEKPVWLEGRKDGP